MDDQQRRLAEELLFSEKKAPSPAKLLYFGVLDPTRLFPYPHLSPEKQHNAKQLIAEVEKFMDQNLDPKLIDEQAHIPESVISGLAKLGVLGMTVPKIFSGLEMPQTAYCQLTEKIAQRCNSTALLINAHQSIGLRALLLFGTPEQQTRWLPDLATGKTIGAFSLTEANAGSDASGVETRATYIPEKNVWRLNGRKQWTTNGSIAGVLTVMARTEINTPQGKQDKITAFLVTPNMPGFKIQDAALKKVGMRGTKTSNILFENVEVPPHHVLGELGTGLKVCLTVLDYGRTTFGAMCTGSAKYLLKRATEHARTRMQFKRPLSSFPLVKEKLALMAAHVYAMDATTYMVAGLLDKGNEDIMLEAAILKVFASESLWQIIYDTMQIFGGRSFFTDEPFERIMRDSRLNMIGEGSNEVLRAFIGLVGMRDVGVALQDIQQSWKNPINASSKLLSLLKHGIRSTKISNLHPSLKKEVDRLQKEIHRFGWSVKKLLFKYKEDIIEQQFQLNRIAEGAMALFTTACVLSKLSSELESGLITKAKEASALLYCHFALDKWAHEQHGISHNDDDEIAAVSDLWIKDTP